MDGERWAGIPLDFSTAFPKRDADFATREY